MPRSRPLPRPRGPWSETWRMLLAASFSAVGLVSVVTDAPSALGWAWHLSAGAAAFAGASLRHRWPFAAAVTTILLFALAPIAVGPALLTLVSFATYLRAGPLVLVAGLHVGSSLTSNYLSSRSLDLWWVSLSLAVLITAVLCTWGLYLGSRRELLLSLADRASRAETEQRLRVETAERQERTRIAREMHDVLAHRITHIAMQAGAIDRRRDLAIEDVREQVTLVRQTARAALEDLRGVLQVLREDDADTSTSPGPTHRDLPALFGEHRARGAVLEVGDRLTDEVPDQLGRTVYRVVQESLTNAAKHATGEAVQVELSGGPGVGVSLRVANAVHRSPVHRPPAGSGLGLIGMRERVELLGGRLDHRVDRGGTFQLRCWIPWPP